MKRVLTAVLLLFTISLLTVSCGGGSQPATENNETTAQADAGPYAKLPKEIQDMMPAGEQIYKTKCVACHGEKGLGVENMFPPLAQADYLLADKVRAVKQTLNGSNEGMVVNGKKYSLAMPPQVETKEDAVAVINYVLNNFGNDGGYVTLQDVASVEVAPRPAAK